MTAVISERYYLWQLQFRKSTNFTDTCYWPAGDIQQYSVPNVLSSEKPDRSFLSFLPHLWHLLAGGAFLYVYEDRRKQELTWPGGFLGIAPPGISKIKGKDNFCIIIKNITTNMNKRKECNKLGYIHTVGCSPNIKSKMTTVLIVWMNL